MTKSADNLGKASDAPPTKRPSKYQMVFKESQRSHTGQLSMNRMYSLNREISPSVKSIHTEPVFDLDSQNKLSPIIFDRNHGSNNQLILSPMPETLKENKDPIINLNLLNQQHSPFRKSVHSEKSSICNCLICCDRNSNAVFMDCGHGGEKIYF